MALNKQVDQFIVKAQPFAQPILHHFRALVHHTCPKVVEKIKWGMPFFEYKGDNLCHMASFKKHCAFGFWKASLMKDKTLTEATKTEAAMGNFGKITSPSEMPSDKKIMAWIKDAMKLNEAGIKLKKDPAKTAQEVEIPSDLLTQLKKNKNAVQAFTNFSNACKREYIQWITDAKTDATRQKRLDQAIEWIAEGKKRNWKYEKC
ncbi:MAG: YdeI/OmpD-associated family protein [Chitinophagaceae bacterium]